MNDNLVYHKWQCLKYEQYDGCETIKVLRDGGDPGRRSYLRSSERPKQARHPAQGRTLPND